MLNQGYAYTTTIGSQSHGQALLSHLATLYPHSTPQAWQQKLDNQEVTLNGIPATGAESLWAGQTLIWNRPPWIEPDAPQHFEVLFHDDHLLAVNKPGGLPTPAAASWKTPSCASYKSRPPTPTPSTA
jgi:23S rRNA pseudouridine1911/1915/1917 synthase